MTNEKNTPSLGDIIIECLRSYKVFSSVTLVFCLLGSIWGYTSTPVYYVSATLGPAERRDISNLSGSGLGFLSGGALGLFGGSSQTNVLEARQFLQVIRSPAIAERVMQNQELMRALFPDQWDPRNNEWRPLNVSLISGLLYESKEGEPVIFPDPNIFSDWLLISVEVIFHEEYGFWEIRHKNSDRDAGLALVQELVDQTEAYIREEKLALKNMEASYLLSKIEATQSQVHRDILAQLIARNEADLVILSSGQPYSLSYLLRPNAPQRAKRDKFKLGTLGGFFGGFLLAFLVVYFRAFGRRYWVK